MAHGKEQQMWQIDKETQGDGEKQWFWNIPDNKLIIKHMNAQSLENKIEELQSEAKGIDLLKYSSPITWIPSCIGRDKLWNFQGSRLQVKTVKDSIDKANGGV